MLPFDYRFEKALIENGETLETFKEFRKYKSDALVRDGMIVPDHQLKCICGVHIQENCYAAHKDKRKVLVLGNCCIKRTMTPDQRLPHCRECDQPHKNRKHNLCKPCRKDADAQAKIDERERKVKEKADKVERDKMERAKMTFGKKYKGVPIKDICENDNEYVDWVFEKLDPVKFKDTLNVYRYFTGRE